MRKQNIKIKYNCYKNVIKTQQKLNIKGNKTSRKELKLIKVTVQNMDCCFFCCF